MQNINTLNIGQEQLDACERWTNENTGEVFYLVESQSKPGTHYKVIYDRQRKCLRCLPHDGEACPASVKGLTCWHMKAAVAHAEIYREERREEQAEQSKLTRLVNQGVSREVASLIAYADEHPFQHTELEVKRDQARCQRKPFSILR